MLAFDRRAPNSLIQLLLQSGADPHLSDGCGKTVLHFAIDGLNVWAIKWLVAENVDLETLVGYPGNLKPFSQYLLDCCEAIFLWGDTDFTYVLNSLRVIQLLAVSWTQHVGNTFSIKQTHAQLIEYLRSFIPKSVELSQARCFQTYTMVGEDLQEIRETVHILTDMLSNPLSLRHLCRAQIRRSLGRDFRKRLNQLNVPLPLQQYLRIYKQSDILL